jgi:gamma-glutamyltranspeptidase/glutathione hydrolase/leukotriene-C4 hydrolase
MTSLNTHRFIEAMKHSFGARSAVTDPAFVDDASRLDDFYTKEWADGIRPKITDVSDFKQLQ